MLDLSLIGMPLMYRHRSPASVCPRRGPYSRGMRSPPTSWRSTRLYQLRRGGELHDHAGASQGCNPPTATTISSRTTTSSRCGRSPTTSSTTRASPRPTSPRRGRATGRRREACSMPHALMNQGVSRDLYRDAQRRFAREGALRRSGGPTRRRRSIPRPLPRRAEGAAEPTDAERKQRRPGLPEENLLYFLRRTPPSSEDWKRERRARAAAAVVSIRSGRLG